MSSSLRTTMKDIDEKLLDIILRMAVQGSENQQPKCCSLKMPPGHCLNPHRLELHNAMPMTLSLVCKRWSKRILMNKSTWAKKYIDVDCQTVSHIKTLDKDRELVIQSCACTTNTKKQDFNTDAWKYVFDNLHRVGSLEIQINYYNDSLSKLADGLRKPAPQLQHFLFSNQGAFWNNGRPVVLNESFRIPRDVFGFGDSNSEKSELESKLTTMKIAGVYLDGPSLAWKMLTVLNVDYTLDTSHTFTLSAEYWLDMLRQMTLLQELHLFGAFSPEKPKERPQTSDQFSNPQHEAGDVDLHFLSNLTFVTGKERAVIFEVFAKLNIPYNCQVFLSVENPTERTPYPEYAFERMMLGLERRKQGLEAGGKHFHIELQSLHNREFFRFVISLNDSPGQDVKDAGNQNFEFCQKPSYAFNVSKNWGVQANARSRLWNQPALTVKDWPLVLDRFRQVFGVHGL